MVNSVDTDQTAPTGAVCSGSTLFASILNSSVLLGKYLQQTTSADNIIQMHFFLGALSVNPFPAFHNICRLLSHLLMYFSGLYYKLYGPRSDCSLRSSLIRVHSICFHDQKQSVCI